MSAIHLAGLGWTAEEPAGNRLRWTYPGDVPSEPLGLPEAVVVERAPVKGAGKHHGKEPRSLDLVPAYWWEPLDVVSFASTLPPLEHDLRRAFQALRFTYRGPTARVLVLDGPQLVADRVVNDGERITFEGPRLNRLVVLAFGAVQLTDVLALDLFADRGLDWQPVATIGVHATSEAALEDALARTPVPPAVSADDWKLLRETLRRAHEAPGDSAEAGQPTNWELLEMVLGARFGAAVLAGFGFTDGPGAGSSGLNILHDVLGEVPHAAVAYRVRDVKDRMPPSNVCLCAPMPVRPLAAPTELDVVEAVTRLAADERFDGKVSISWRQRDPRALGVQVEQEVSSSAVVASEIVVEKFESRARRADGGFGEGEVSRSLELPFHDITTRVRARASDGWDRVSGASDWTHPVGFALIHDPPAPPLAAAHRQGNTVHIERASDWAPDAVVAAAGGRVVVYRRTAVPADARVDAGSPVPMGHGRYRIPLIGVFDPAQFDGGFLERAETRLALSRVDAGVVEIAPGEQDGATLLFEPGVATLVQRPTHPGLWTPVIDFPCEGLPPTLSFTDVPAAAPGAADVQSYHCRVAFLGRVGPPSGTVQVVRLPPTPAPPPSFSVAALGCDYYGRTMVKVTFAEPVGAEARFTIWWALSDVSPTDLETRGSRGDYEDQRAGDGTTLFDILPLPITRSEPETVTIGVQRLDAASGQSRLVTARLELLPPR